MPWVRFDDQYPIHRKVAALSDAAYRLHSSAIFWSVRNSTDGCVPHEDLELVSAQVRNPARFVRELVRRGLLHEAGTECPSVECPADGTQADAWVIHDFLEFQPSKAKVERNRKLKADRQRRWLESRKQGGNHSKSQIDASQDAPRDASIDAPPAPAPAPAPKEAGAGGGTRAPAAAGEAGAAGRAHPSGSPGRAGEQDQPPCAFTDDGYGTCVHCNLPAANRTHTGGGDP